MHRGEASSDNDSRNTLLGSRFRGGRAKEAVTRAYECFVSRNKHKQFVHERRYERVVKFPNDQRTRVWTRSMNFMSSSIAFQK